MSRSGANPVRVPADEKPLEPVPWGSGPFSSRIVRLTAGSFPVRGTEVAVRDISERRVGGSARPVVGFSDGGEGFLDGGHELDKA